jgi:murein L,D-transpeptidase YafK
MKWLRRISLCLLGGMLLTAGTKDDFLAQQLAHARVRAAAEAKRSLLKALFARQGLAYPPKGVFLRVFKQDRELELWGQAADGRYALVKTYAICASSGELGPKRQEGDSQVPEGFYQIWMFNPASAYHLSLGVSYPNASDRIRGVRSHLGGAIMVHGNCVTIGCVPLTDAMIEEVYVAAMDARANGQASIEAHFFPTRLDEAGLKRLAEKRELLPFWRELKPGYDAFEETHRLPKVSVDARGRYVVAPR